MSLTQQMREKLENEKKKVNAKDQLVDSFNDASLTLIKQFIGNVKSGAISIDDTADLMRLFQIYEKINDIQTGDSGSGQLPAMTGGQKGVLDESLNTQKKIINGVEEDVVDLDELSNLSMEEVTNLLNKREVTVNKENEAGI